MYISRFGIVLAGILFITKLMIIKKLDNNKYNENRKLNILNKNDTETWVYYATFNIQEFEILR